MKLAENGKSVDIELFDNPKVGSVDVDDYHLTVNIAGDELTYSFNRSTYAKSFVTDVDVLKNKFTIFTDKGSTKTYDVPASMKKQDLQELLGETVGIWYDNKNKPTDVELVTRKAKYDAIEITKIDEIRLLSEGKTYNVSTAMFEGSSTKKQFTFYLDGKKVEIADRDDLKKKVKVKDRFTHAKISFDNLGNIVFISAYNLHDFLIVDRVKDQEVIGYAGEGTGGIFNAKDALIMKDGRVIELSDLRRGDVMFFNEKGNKGKGIAEVVQPAAKGTIDSVSSKDIRITGMTYRFNDTDYAEDYKVNYGAAVYLHPDGKTEFIDSDVAKELQKSGTVEVYADRAGNMVYIAGGPVTVGRKQSVAILIDDIIGDREGSREFLEVEALLATGEKKWYTSELENLKTIIVDDVVYTINHNGRSDWKIEFEYKDKKNRKDPTAILLTAKTDKKTVKVPLTKTKGSLVRLHMDRSNGKLETIEFFKKRSAKKKVVVKSSDSQISGKRLNPETIIFDTEYFSNHSNDIRITKWGEHKGSIQVTFMIFDENNNILALITD